MNLIESISIEGARQPVQNFDRVKQALYLLPAVSNIEVRACNSGEVHRELIEYEDNSLVNHTIGAQRIAVPVKGGWEVLFHTGRFSKDLAENKEVVDALSRLAADSMSAKKSGGFISQRDETQLKQQVDEINRKVDFRLQWILTEIEKAIFYGLPNSQFFGLASYLTDTSKDFVQKAQTLSATSTAYSVYFADMTDGLSLLYPSDASGIITVGRWEAISNVVDAGNNQKGKESYYWKEINAQAGIRVNTNTGIDTFGVGRLANISLREGKTSDTGTIFDVTVRNKLEKLARQISLTQTGNSASVVHGFVSPALYQEMLSYYRTINGAPSGANTPAYAPRVVADIANQRDDRTVTTFGQDASFMITPQLVIHATNGLRDAEAAL